MKLYKGSTTLKLLTPLGRFFAAAWKKHRLHYEVKRKKEEEIPCDKFHVPLKKHRRLINIVCSDTLLCLLFLYIYFLPTEINMSDANLLFCLALVYTPFYLSLFGSPLFAYPLHRLIRVCYCRPEDKIIPLTWISRLGKYLSSRKGMIYTLLFIGFLTLLMWAKVTVYWQDYLLATFTGKM